jgi:hypothetical protein
MQEYLQGWSNVQKKNWEILWDRYYRAPNLKMERTKDRRDIIEALDEIIEGDKAVIQGLQENIENVIKHKNRLLQGK